MAYCSIASGTWPAAVGVGQGWSHAARDPQVRRVLSLMHERSAHPWTLDDLAQQAGLSRTALAAASAHMGLA